MSKTPRVQQVLSDMGGLYDMMILAKRLERENAALLAALKDVTEAYDSIIHDEYDGTTMLAAKLAVADSARALVAKSEQPTDNTKGNHDGR